MSLSTNVFCKTHRSAGELVVIHYGERAYVYDTDSRMKKELTHGDERRVLPGESIFVFRDAIEFHLDFPNHTRNTHMTFHIRNTNPEQYYLQFMINRELTTIEILQQEILNRNTVAELGGMLDRLNEDNIRDLLSKSMRIYGLTLERICIIQTPLKSYRKDPKIRLDFSASGCVDMPIDFVFESKRFQATLHIPKKLINGASRTPRLLGGVPNDLSAFCLDAAQDELYNVLLDYFDEIKENYKLTNNQYVSLLTSYVQSLKYDNSRCNPESPQYYPVETISSGSGVCSDTALLLAALLAKRNYDVAYMSFSAENHGVAGIRVSDGQGFRGSDYLTIDTTAKYDIGYCPPNITSLPIVTKIGSGNRKWLALTPSDTVLHEEIIVMMKEKGGNKCHQSL